MYYFWIKSYNILYFVNYNHIDCKDFNKLSFYEMVTNFLEAKVVTFRANIFS